MHGSTHQIELRGDEGIKSVVERIAERGGKHHGSCRPRLMMVIDDLREPLVVQHPVHVRRFRLRREVKIPVVVVADVFLIELRNAGPGASRERIRIAHVPARHQFHPVRIRVHREDDHVVQDPHRLGVVP